MSRTIKLNETSLVCDKPHTIQCWKKGKEIKHPHPLKWYPDGGEIVVLKRWKLEEILDPNGPINDSKFWNFRKKPFLMGPFAWCTPQLWVQEAGFVYEGDIDVKILFGGGPWVPHTWRDLRKVQVQLEEELDKFGYKDRDLIIYRTIRASQINWDSIAVFSEKRVPVGS